MKLIIRDAGACSDVGQLRQSNEDALLLSDPVFAVAAVGIVVAVAVAIGLQWAHFIGATPDGRVAIYQGLPIELTTDVTLYRAVEISDVPTAALSQDQRATLLDQRIGSRGSAEDRIMQLTTASPWLRLPPSAQ